MKKLLIIIGFLSLLLFSGCNGLDDGYYDDEQRFYLIDQNSHSVSNISYSCDNGRTYERTSREGAFYFYSNEECDLSLNLRLVDSEIDNLFIEDDIGRGVEGIIYYCDNGDEGRTDRRGHFYFDNRDRDDTCTLVL